MEGLSITNLKYMRSFAQSWADFNEAKIGQQAVDQIPWGRNIILLQKLKDSTERLWYANKTIENGWSRNIIVHQIENRLMKRQRSWVYC